MRQVVIVSGARTAIGDFGGQFFQLKANDLATVVVKEALARANIDHKLVNEVVLGCCFQRTDEANVARVATLRSGLPDEVPAYTINKVCNSAMQAIFDGSFAISLGESDIVVAGGTESMSNAEYVVRGMRWGQRMRHGIVVDSMWEALQGGGFTIPMGITAENLAVKYNISREEQDEFSSQSNMRAVSAIKEGRFKDEIVPVEIQRGKVSVKIDTDEHPRADATVENLSRLKPTFKEGGTVTAGNASGINDGAAAVVLMAEEKARELGIKPLARIVAYSSVGVNPNIMGFGPVPATQKILAKTGLNLEDIQLIECNEAFAAQYLACEKSLGWNREIVNVNGGGISLGHPVGCTGARIVITLMYEMVRKGLRLGLATLCGGGGIGTSIIIENISQT